MKISGKSYNNLSQFVHNRTLLYPQLETDFPNNSYKYYNQSIPSPMYYNRLNIDDNIFPTVPKIITNIRTNNNNT